MHGIHFLISWVIMRNSYRGLYYRDDDIFSIYRAALICTMANLAAAKRPLPIACSLCVSNGKDQGRLSGGGAKWNSGGQPNRYTDLLNLVDLRDLSDIFLNSGLFFQMCSFQLGSFVWRLGCCCIPLACGPHSF